MPRGAWLALGGLGAALLASLATAWALPVAIAGLVTAPVAAALALRHRVREAALVFGVASIGLRLALGGLAAPITTPAPTRSLDGPWTARVLALGSTDGGSQRAVLLVAADDDRSAMGGGVWRVYAWLPRYPVVIPTDRIAFDGRVEPVSQDGSEFAAYLVGNHLVATSRTPAFRVLEASEDPFGIAEHLRGVADAALARVLPEPMAGLASGILVGRRDRVSREVAESFTATGLSHVVAISGWNICLVGAVIGSLLSAAGLSRRSRSLGIIVALGCFTLLAGTGASVVRAACMGGVALIARETGRPGSALAALGLAVWMLLLLDPSMVSDVGFQLSVTATAGLLWWGSRLTHRLAGAAPNRPRRWLAESLGVSLAAQAATLPLILFHFGRLSLVSPLANLLIAPIVAPAMLVGFVALVAGLVVGAGVPFVVGAPFALLGWLVLGAMVAIAGVLAQVPLASLALPPLLSSLLAVAAALAIGAAAWRARDRDTGVASPLPRPAGTRTPPEPRPRGLSIRAHHRRALALACMAVVLLASVGAMVGGRAGPGRLTVTVLDVGQGDAILVDGPRGGRMLLDSGPDPDRLLTVLDRHVPAWDRRLDLVVLTHPHEDHVAGLAMLVQRYRVAAIAENGMLGAGPGDSAFRTWLAAARMSTQRLAAGDRLTLDGIAMDVRWPIRGTIPERSPSVGRQVNDTSIVLDVRYGVRRMLLTGDIEDDVDPSLLLRGIGEPAGARLDVLKVAHHGSRTATSEAWLHALEPRIAMISAGTGNPYGHPAPETVARLRTHGARVLRTDLDGDLEVSTDGHDLQVSTSGGRPTAEATLATTTSSVVFAPRYLCAIPLSAARLAALPPPPARHPPFGRPGLPSPPPRIRHSSPRCPWASGPTLATIGPDMVPSHTAAAALLLSLSPSIWLRRHASAVADVASFLAVAAIRAGHPVDRAVVEAAAILHDLDKALPAGHPLRSLGHGHAGARWLIEHGYGELGPAVESHPVGRLTDQPYEEWVGLTTLEQRIVAYADKRAQQRVVTMDQRFDRWRRKHPDAADELALARVRAGLLEADMCAVAGVSPLGVQRRPWATAALREAESGTAGSPIPGSPR